jgi:hypothetical protein
MEAFVLLLDFAPKTCAVLCDDQYSRHRDQFLLFRHVAGVPLRNTLLDGALLTTLSISRFAGISLAMIGRVVCELLVGRGEKGGLPYSCSGT